MTTLIDADDDVLDIPMPFLAVASEYSISMPKLFVQGYSEDFVGGSVSQNDVDTVLQGPFHPDYFVAWNRLISTVRVNLDGDVYRVSLSDGIWLLPIN